LIDTPEKRAWGRFLLVVARLQPDVTLEAARAELAAIARTRERESAANSGWSASVVPLKEQITGDARLPLLAALAGVTVLLALAVVNVGTLTLAFMRRRRHELSIRRAIGATDGRLFRQLFTQSVLVGTAGAAIGLLAAVPGLSGLVAVLPPELPRASSIALDRPVLLTCIAVAAIATMLFGTGCALRGRSSRQTGHGRNVPGTRTSDRLSGGTLVATEIALGLALAIVALLMTRSFGSLRSVDLGFDSTGVVAARVALSPGYDTPDRRRGFFDALLERLRATPGVTEAGLISTRPFGGESVSTTAHDGDAPEPAVAERLSADVRYVDSGFFRTLRIPLVTGEAFEEEPAATAPPSVVINERLARSIWAERNPVGRRLRISLFGTITGRVVGVARDVHLLDARTPPRPTLYLSDRRFPSDARDILVRADGDPDAIIPSLRAALAAVDPVLPLYQVAVMPRTVNESLAADRFIAVLLAVFAASALLLAGVGIFGVFSSDVASRRREIAIRMALGAHETSVAMLMLRRALFRAIPGIAIGSALAFVLARSMSSLLFGVEPGDPLIYLTAAAVVLLLVMLATLVPAWQALLRSPLSVLREG
jgi:predicted permease